MSNSSYKVRYCRRCAYRWCPSSKKHPVRCPNCHSRVWELPINYSKLGVSA